MSHHDDHCGAVAERPYEECSECGGIGGFHRDWCVYNVTLEIHEG